MKKHKLHLFTKLAAVTLFGSLPLHQDAANAQDSVLPPIVSGKKLSVPMPKYAYARDSSGPLVPALVSPQGKIVPPIVSGKADLSGAKKRSADSAVIPPVISGSRMTPKKEKQLAKPAIKAEKKGLLSPIGTGIKKVSGSIEPKRVARAFSPSRIPVRTQGSSSLGSTVPAIQIPAPTAIAPSLAAPAAINSLPGVIESAPAQMAPVISGTLLTPGAVQPAFESVPEAPTYFDAAPVNQPVDMPSVVSGCSECGGSAAGCNSCGGPSYDPNKINCDYGTYGSVSAAKRYAYLEFLYLTREDGDITNSNFNPLGAFDFSPGWRFTFGQRPDMTQGREISYFGTSGIDARQATNDSANRLDALFVPGGGLVNNDLSAFFDASRHVQFKETSLHSLELNRVRWGWDVLKSFVGWRYIYMDDQYQLDSTAPVRDAFGLPVPGSFESGRYRIDTVNHLLGAHIGAELFYDIGFRFSLSGLSKYGVYANINKVDNFLESGGTTILDTEDNGANIASTWEIHLLAHYQIRQTARLRFGYNGLFLSNVATVSDNFSGFVSPFTGFNGTDDDDAFIHGFTLGLEIYR